jgi:hypothetical protein
LKHRAERKRLVPCDRFSIRHDAEAIATTYRSNHRSAQCAVDWYEVDARGEGEHVLSTVRPSIEIIVVAIDCQNDLVRIARSPRRGWRSRCGVRKADADRARAVQAGSARASRARHRRRDENRREPCARARYSSQPH